MRFGQRQPNNNKYYKILGDLKILRRDQWRCSLVFKDESLSEATRKIISDHLTYITGAIERHELDLARIYY